MFINLWINCYKTIKLKTIQFSTSHVHVHLLARYLSPDDCFWFFTLVVLPRLLKIFLEKERGKSLLHETHFLCVVSGADLIQIAIKILRSIFICISSTRFQSNSNSSRDEENVFSFNFWNWREEKYVQRQFKLHFVFLILKTF